MRVLPCRCCGHEAAFNVYLWLTAEWVCLRCYAWSRAILCGWTLPASFFGD